MNEVAYSKVIQKNTLHCSQPVSSCRRQYHHYNLTIFPRLSPCPKTTGGNQKHIKTPISQNAKSCAKTRQGKNMRSATKISLFSAVPRMSDLMLWNGVICVT
jgi:hypothetical protein